MARRKYRGIQERYLSAAEMDEAINFLLDVAEQTGVAVALAGGVAAGVWGSTRLTRDVDIIAGGVLPLEPSTPLSFGGIRSTSPGGVEVDVIVRDDDLAELYAEALVNAIHVDDIPVVSPEHLAVIKLAVLRERDSGTDHADLMHLLARDDFDHALAERIAVRHFGGLGRRELQSLAAEAAWRRTRRS